MEKIYMEENRNKKKSVVDSSVVLSFVVAFFAIFSLIACGFDQISYAAPVSGDNLTFYKGENDDGDQLYVTGYTDAGKTFRVPLYFSDAAFKNPIFCIEHQNVNTETGVIYNRAGVIEDYGLLYLLNNSYVNGKNIGPNGTTNMYSEAWLTQVAIWLYLAETDPSNPMNAIDADDLATIKAVSIIRVNMDATNDYDCVFGETLYDKYIKPLIDEAKSASSAKRLTVNKEAGEIVKTSDGKFYQSTLMSAVGSPSGDLINYDVKVSGIDGTIIVDESGNQISGNGLSPNAKFYVRIPADKVTETVQNLKVDVVGHFNSLTGHVYEAATTSEDGTYQKIVSVTGATTDVSSGLTIEVVGAPNTAMTTAQTIYFIGLIVLLCGVGIIYANAKPFESKQ